MDKKKTIKTAIYGGSFDPPHFGHVDIVSNLEKAFDRVIVVPSFISPFKSGASDCAARFKLCKKLFASEKTEVSKREINKKGVSYSVDTAKHFHKKFPDEKLFWVIGSEELIRLTEWKDIDDLKKLVTFFVVPRPGYAADGGTLAALKKRGIKIKFAKFDGLDVSSTEIKVSLAFDKPNRFLPDCVYSCAKKNGLFNPYSKYVKALFKYKLSQKRINHTFGVAVRGAELAKLYGGNVSDAVVACLLHDIAKSVSPDDYRGKVDVSGFPPPTIHAPIGAYIAKREFGVSDEIEHAIRVHSTGDAEMSLLDEIVYLADKTESGRNYSEVYYFRYLCSIDKDLAMYVVLREVEAFKDNLPCEMTARAIDRYTALCNGKTLPEMPQQPDETLPPLPAIRVDNSIAHVASKSIKAVEPKDKSVRVVPEAENGKSVRVVSSREGAARPAAQSAAKEENKDGVKRDASSTEMAEALAKELDLHKAHDIDIIDLEGKTIVADYFIIASATSSTAVKSLCDYVEERMTKSFGLDPSKRDVNREWVALDYGVIIVHIFTDKMREFYNIERLWSDGTNVRRYGV